MTSSPVGKMRELDMIAGMFCEEDGFELVLLRYRIEEVMARMRGSSLLDVGCGVGNLCRAVAGRMDRVVGIDGSGRKIEMARRAATGLNVEYVVSLFEEFQPSDVFDTVVMNNVLEHVDDPVGLLRLVAGWMADDGMAIITVPNAHSLNKQIGLRMGLVSSLYEITDGDRQKGHVRVYDRNSLTADSG